MYNVHNTVQSKITSQSHTGSRQQWGCKSYNSNQVESKLGVFTELQKA